MTDPEEIQIKDTGLRNIVLLSFSFMLIFTALVTTGNIEQTILKSLQKEDPDFTGDGYTSLAIVYIVFAFANSLAPSLVAVLKAKRTLIVCSCFYILFIINLLFTTTWSLYLVSALLGLAAAGLWTAQGNYLTLNSTKDTITRNTGIFWVFLCCSQFLGNAFVFWQFFGKTHIDSHTRTVVLTFLTFIGSGGMICFWFLNTPTPKIRDSEAAIDGVTHTTGPISAFRNSFKILKQRNMQLMILPFLFIGTNQTFFAGVYPTAVGFTKQFGTISKSLVGLSGIFTGAGGLLGGGMVMIFGPRVSKKVGRTPIVSLGCIFLSTAYILVYFNIPDEAPLRPTDNSSIIDPPSPIIAMMCSFLLGLGDSLVHTQIYGTLSTLWTQNSAEAFAILHFFKSFAVASQFLYSTQMGLLGQLIMLQVFCVLSCIAFSAVDRIMRNSLRVAVKDSVTDSTVLQELNKN